MIPRAIRQFARRMIAGFLLLAATVAVAASDPPKQAVNPAAALSALGAKAEAIRPKIDAAAGDDAKLVQVRTELELLSKEVSTLPSASGRAYGDQQASQ